MIAHSGRAENVSVGIVGGGIGGLTAALSLLHRGFDVHVYEQAPMLIEVGAGVQVSPNASRVLHGLGLAAELARAGVKPLAWHQRRWDDGRTLLRSPLAEPLEAAFGSPHYQMHRADLLSALAAGVPAGRLHLGHRLTGLVDHRDRVEALFANGASAEVDVLVGADGIRSLVRRALFGPENPRFTGCVAYRGLVPAERLSELGLEVTAQVWMGPGRHFVHYFVSGGRLVNFVAVIEQDTWTRESWTDRGDPADALAAFAGWHPQVRAILEAVDETFIWALFDRTPLERWSAGRVTLLGDACHAMLPFMAQGAAQAIEDAATLASCLASAGSDLPSALHRYEILRIPRASRLQAMSTANKKRFHLADGPEQRERDAEMSAGSTDWSFGAVAWIYEHDASGVLLPPPGQATLPQSARYGSGHHRDMETAGLPEFGVCVAVDVHYPRTGGARAAAVLAADAAFAHVLAERTAVVPRVPPYQPGEFYLRELPPLHAVLDGLSGLGLLVVDGYADLDPGGRPGLGAHAHAAFGIPVIGVAKSRFRTATHAVPVVRGSAVRPLFVTAAGMPGAEAAELVRRMAGRHRLPDALRRADTLARTDPPALSTTDRPPD